MLPEQREQWRRLVTGPEPSVAQVRAAVQADLGMTLSVLAAATDAQVPSGSDLTTAVQALGTARVQHLALQAMDDAGSPPSEAVPSLRVGQHHALATAALAAAIATPAAAASAELAGLLLACGERFELRRPGSAPGGSITQLTSRLLTACGVAPAVAAAVEAASRPLHAPRSGLGVPGAVRTAQLLMAQAHGCSPCGAEPLSAAGRSELAMLLAHSQVPSGVDWQGAAREACAAAAAGAAADARRSGVMFGGDRFSTLPASARSSRRDSTPSATPPASDGHVLVVDDDPSIRLLISELLKMDGFAVRTAVDGISALEELRQNPACVVLDVMMPRLDGHGVLQHIRNLPGPPLPVIMLTASADTASSRRAWSGGADHFLSTPFSPDELVQLVAAITHSPAAPLAA
ncbi:MAG: response regulator transcription factor [Actinomycetota bacterium]|nr:response regulator transcription factor [Actinomycetota bacterium]